MSFLTQVKTEVIRFSPRRLIRRLQKSYIEFHGPAPSKLPVVGFIGAVAHPFYYFVWSTIVPQPYENLRLRLFAAALCLPIGLRAYWPSRLLRHYLLYCYVSIMLVGQAFFTFMLLQNNVNSVWLMSTTAILLFTMLLYDLANAIVVTATGSTLACIAYWLQGGDSTSLTHFLLVLPVFAFILSAVAFLSHSQSLISQDRLLAARAFAGSVAHEMRTPLLGIRFDAEILEASLKRMTATDRPAAADPDDAADELEADRKAKAAAGLAVGRIRDQVNAANLVIDTLLLNLRQNGYRGESLQACRIADAINHAMLNYPFRSGERELVTVRIKSDFQYQGVQVLMVHVLYNLLKNGLRAIAGRSDGRITIEADADKNGNRITVTDTGRGIDPLVRPFIFIPFVTGNQDMNGTGVGLFFCRGVVEGFGGTISCSSKVDAFTRFTIQFPQLKPSGPDHTPGPV